MSDKSKDPKKTPSTKRYTGVVYPSILDGVQAVLKERAKDEIYPIADFYKASLVGKALDSVHGGQVKVKGSGFEINQADIKQKLASNLKPLKAFYDKQKDKALAITYYQRLKADTAKTLEPYFQYGAYSMIASETYKSDVQRQLQNSGNRIVIKGAELAKDQPRIYGYGLPDKAKLIKALDKLPASEKIPHKDVEISLNIANLNSKGVNTVEGLKQLFTDILELAKACDIEGDGEAVITMGDVIISQTHLELLSTVSLTLATVLDLNTDKKPRSVVNIKEADKHSFIGRPSTTSFIDMVEGAVSGRELQNLQKTYRNKDEREAEGGFLAHIDDIQQALPFLDEIDDKKLQAKFMANSVALAVDAVTALQAYKRDNPDHDGYIKIKDLATYIKRYADDMSVKGSLRPQYRKAILNGLTLAQLMGTDYIVDKNPKTGATKWHKVYLIDRITDYETNKKGDVITVKTDFTAEYKASLSFNLGVVLDGVQNLKTPESKILATYISDRQVAKQDDTIAGKPITCTADTLCTKAGITDQHITNRYNTLAKMLNDLESEGIAIGKWTTKAKNKNITGFNKDSQTIYIYPTANLQQAYTSKAQTRAEREGYKTEQKARLVALKKYAKGYTDLNTLADELNLERLELDQLLAGQQPITDRVLGKIDLEIIN